MNHWLYNNKKITCLDDIENHESIVGFVYQITNKQTGKIYIGKKILHNSRKTRISKKEKTTTATRKTFKRVVKESNWLDYWGSCKPLLEDLKQLGEEEFKREILEFCCTKKYLSFAEIEHQIKNDVLKRNTYNGNILSRYFQKDMQNCFNNELLT
jgi:hypothetical protein